MQFVVLMARLVGLRDMASVSRGIPEVHERHK